MRKETILNELTVGDFLGIYCISVQEKMSDLNIYVVENGRIVVGGSDYGET